MADKPGGHEVGRISIRVLPDTSRFRRDLKGDLERIEDTVRGTVHVEAELDAAGAVARMRETVSRLQAMGSRGVDIDVRIDRNRLSRLGASISSAISDAGSNGSKGLGGMAGTAALVAGIAALVAPAAALVSGALVSLPALAAGIATPLAAVALGLDGIKESAQALAPEMERLKKAVGDSFRNGLTPVFTQLKSVFPALERSIPKVATGMTTVAQSLVDVITSPVGLARVESTIANIGETIRRSAPGVASFADGILTLADKVSQKFPGIADVFGEQGKKFLGWVDGVTTAGPDGTSKLDTAMSNLGKTLKPLLGIVKDLAAQGFEWLSDPDFGNKMERFATNLRTVVDKVLPDLKTVFEGIEGTLDKVLTLSDKLKQFDAATGASSATTNKDGSKKDTGNIFEPFTSKDAPWRTAWDETKTSFQSTLEVIKTGLGTAWAVFGAKASSAWANVKGLANGVWNGVEATAQAVWNRVVQIVSSALTNVGSFFSSIPAKLSAAWSNLSGIANAAWQGVTAAVQSAWQNVSSAVSTGVNTVVQFVSELPGKITNALGDLGSLLVSAGKAAMDGLLSGIKSGVQAVYDFVSGIAGKIADLKGPLPYDRKVLIPNGTALMEGLGAGIESGLDPVLDKVRGIASQVQDAMTVDGVRVGGSEVGGLDYAQRAMGVGKDFASATGGQFMSDLGIGGNGAIPQLFGYAAGLGEALIKGAGSKVTYNVSSVHEALAAERNRQNVQMLTYRR